MIKPASFDKTLKPTNYQLLRKALQEFSGLALTDNKMYLVESRLQSVAQAHQYQSLDQLIEELKGPKGRILNMEIAEAMATPETFFFRDKKPFDQFKDVVIPRLLEANAKTKQVQIWCCACSSGQEPYSLAMIIDELKVSVLKGWQVKILATDFSNKILQRAKEAAYTQFEVQRGLPIQYLMKYFVQKEQQWVIKDTLKNMVEFHNFNLLHSPAGLGRFDVIFCRNVLFYFDIENKQKILHNLGTVLNPHGVLFLGSAESPMGVSQEFTSLPEYHGIFVKK
jgi:chemotaxis protein methyltransferase CheR